MSSLKNVLVSGGVALAVAFLVAFGFVSVNRPSVSDPSLGYSQGNTGEFPEGALIGDVGIAIKKISLPVGINQASYRNTSGRTQYVDLAVLATSATATNSPYRLIAGTSTSASFNTMAAPSANFTTLVNASVASSSLATSTSNLRINTSQSGHVRLLDGEYLNVALIQGFTGTPNASCNGNVCESATSTNRGFNVTGLIRILQP